jgi:hypothetical protein
MAESMSEGGLMDPVGWGAVHPSSVPVTWSTGTEGGTRTKSWPTPVERKSRLPKRMREPGVKWL